jgi:hypothetical protein
LYVRHCRCQCLQLGTGFFAFRKLGLASALSTRPTHLKFLKDMIEAEPLAPCAHHRRAHLDQLIRRWGCWSPPVILGLIVDKLPDVSKLSEPATCLALSAASSGPKTQYTFAATLWCTMVRLSSLTMSMPNSYNQRKPCAPTHHHVFVLELKWVALDAFRGKPLVVNEGPVGRLDIFDEDLLP